MKIKLIFLMVLGLLSIQSVLVAQDDKVHCKRVDRERLKRAMETVKEENTVPGGGFYGPGITTNGIRYQTDVFIDLIEEAMQGHEQLEGACLLYINYNDWYEAFKSVNRPYKKIPYVEKAYEAKQNIVIDYNRKNVIEIDITNPDTPEIAANVALYWEGGEKSFSYKSIRSLPPLNIINESEITYRLLKYNKNNLVVCDRGEGLKGRALGGFLRLLGKARMTQYRIVPVKGGPQYVLMETKKKVLWWDLTKESELTINLKGETTDGIFNKKIERAMKIEQAKEIEQAKKAKKTLLREIKIQYKQPDEALDYLRIPADKLAECECNNGDS